MLVDHFSNRPLRFSQSSLEIEFAYLSHLKFSSDMFNA